MTRVVFAASGTHPDPWVKLLKSYFPEGDVVAWNAKDDVLADYAVVWAPDAALFETQPRLKAIFSLGAGVDSLLRVPTLPAELPVIRLDDAGMSVQMAEYVCHAVFRHTRELDAFEGAMANQQWTFRKPTRREDFPIGIMGLGEIGRRVATALTQFEFPVLGWSRSHHELPGVTCYAGAESLDAFLAATRILVCILPLTPDTEGILNKATLSKLQPEGYLINVARGAHLVEEDLVALLDTGKLAGATLDVFREEPLPATHPFWGHPKIIMTPHISARTLREKSLAQIAEKIRQMEKGETPVGVVERQRGY